MIICCSTYDINSFSSFYLFLLKRVTIFFSIAPHKKPPKIPDSNLSPTHKTTPWFQFRIGVWRDPTRVCGPHLHQKKNICIPHMFLPEKKKKKKNLAALFTMMTDQSSLLGYQMKACDYREELVRCCVISGVSRSMRAKCGFFFPTCFCLIGLIFMSDRSHNPPPPPNNTSPSRRGEELPSRSASRAKKKNTPSKFGVFPPRFFFFFRGGDMGSPFSLPLLFAAAPLWQSDVYQLRPPL